MKYGPANRRDFLALSGYAVSALGFARLAFARAPVPPPAQAQAPAPAPAPTSSLVPATCYDPATLSLSQKSRRRSLGYADASPDAARSCKGCAFFTAGTTAGCGSCQLLSNGPVNAAGRCNSFAPRPVSTPAPKPATRPVN